MPFDRWLRSDLSSMATRIFRHDLKAMGIFMPERVADIWEDYVAGRSVLYWSDIQAFVSLYLWLDMILDGHWER